MIILRPYESKLFMPVPVAQWRSPSLAQPKDDFGMENRTRFRVRALMRGTEVWVGWFESRDDWDAFLLAIACGTLHNQPSIWHLPTPSWYPGMGDELSYDFATVTFLTTPTGSNQTYNTPGDWNNSANTIECLGAGGSGGAINSSGSTVARYSTGGGGGGYGKYTNLTLAGSITYQLGTGGAAVVLNTTPTTSAGNAGGSTWFNGATQGAASVSGTGGGAGNILNTTPANTNGGTAGSFTGTSGNAGGRGGNIASTASTSRVGTGGGGAGGPNGAGNQGVDYSAAANGATNGGSGDAGSGGSAGTATTVGGTAGSGGNGTEFQVSPARGSGGGGGGGTSGGGTATTAGSGGSYGGGGGGVAVGATATSGAGLQGLIVITYTPIPITAVFTNSPMMGM